MVVSPRPGQMESLRHSGEHLGQPGVGPEVREQAIAHPRPNELPIDHHEPDGLAGRDRGSRQPIPFGAAARDRPDVPLDPGFWALKSS